MKKQSNILRINQSITAKADSNIANTISFICFWLPGVNIIYTMTFARRFALPVFCRSVISIASEKSCCHASMIQVQPIRSTHIVNFTSNCCSFAHLHSRRYRKSHSLCTCMRMRVHYVCGSAVVGVRSPVYVI